MHECHLTLIGPVTSMSEVVNVAVACQRTKRLYIPITFLTERPHWAFSRKREVMLKKGKKIKNKTRNFDLSSNTISLVELNDK